MNRDTAMIFANYKTRLARYYCFLRETENRQVNNRNSPVEIFVIVRYHHHAHGRLITVLSRPSVVTCAFVDDVNIINAVDDTVAVFATVASTFGDAFRS